MIDQGFQWTFLRPWIVVHFIKFVSLTKQNQGAGDAKSVLELLSIAVLLVVKPTDHRFQRSPC